MSNVTMAEQTQTAQGHVKAPQLYLPDAASAAENVLVQALEYCAQKMGLPNGKAAVARLKSDDDVACKYCHYSIAKQVAEALGALDEQVKAVYICDYDATPEDICFGEKRQALPIHLIVRVERKTTALDSLVEALDRALATKIAKMLDRDQTSFILDVQAVDDAEVANRIGYGAMLSSLYNSPIRVWER